MSQIEQKKNVIDEMMKFCETEIDAVIKEPLEQKAALQADIEKNQCNIAQVGEKIANLRTENTKLQASIKEKCLSGEDVSRVVVKIESNDLTIKHLTAHIEEQHQIIKQKQHEIDNLQKWSIDGKVVNKIQFVLRFKILQKVYDNLKEMADIDNQWFEGCAQIAVKYGVEAHKLRSLGIHSLNHSLGEVVLDCRCGRLAVPREIDRS